MKFVIIACLVGAAVAYPSQSLPDNGQTGVCPDLSGATGLTCDVQETCYSDLECTGTKKCCNSPCGKICYNSIITSPSQSLPSDGKLYGMCPDLSAASLTCDEQDMCSSDLECTGTKKCCNSPCGKICYNYIASPPQTQGLPYDGKFGVCSDLSAARLTCDVQVMCYSDLDCTGTKKCCNSPCGKICHNPEVPTDTVKPGQCPVPAKQPVDVCTASTTCQEDIECTCIQKCCDTECGEKRCVTPTDGYEIIEMKWMSYLARNQEYTDKLQKFQPPPIFFQKLFNKPDAIKMCTATPCELKKCQRMANEFTYTLQPKREWGCALATSTEHCMFWLEQGYVDIMVTRDEDIYTAKTKYNLTPVAYEVPYVTEITEPSTSPALKGKQNITLIIARTVTDVNTWGELSGITSCHAHANATSAFKSPICSLIQKEVIPKKGDFVESASEFFDEMCVPDILSIAYNKNETYPDNLVARCPEKEQQKKYEGIEGSLKCIDDTKGKVTFVDHKVVQAIIAAQMTEGVTASRSVDNYKLVCQDRSYPLTEWQQKSCHVSTTPYPTIFMSSKKDTSYKQMVQELLKEAVKAFTSKTKTEAFRIFESTPYTCPETEQPRANLIFSDDSKNFTMLTDDYTYTEDFFNTMETCNQLQPKPRAKFCVTQPEQYTKCQEMKKAFDKTDKVRDVAWGCVKAANDLECMKTILNGTADLTSADTKATFIAGHDFKLQPIVSQYLHKESDEQEYDWKTYTYTVGVMKKSVVHTKFGENANSINLAKLSTCHASVYKVSSFHHPIGWLLANGTIPRVGSVFESVSRFFDSSCLPGAHPDVFRLENDLVLGHELNWGVPGVHLFNFTQPEFFIWNSPHTWTYMNWNGKTPRSYKNNLMSKVDPSMSVERSIDMETVSDLFDQLITVLRSQSQSTQRVDTNTGYSTNVMETQERTMSARQALIDRIENLVTESDVSKKGSALLKLRLNAMDQVEDMLAYYLDIPSMSTIQGETYSWLTHPTIQRFLQVYIPHALDYFSEQFDNSEVRQHELSRYSNPLWLSPTFSQFLESTKSHQNKLCNSCIGYENHKCSLTMEPYSDYQGSLKCLRDNSGDIVFVESHQLDKLVDNTEQLTVNNLVLVCPTGEVVDYVRGDTELVKRCNFGRVPQPTIMTAYNKTGSYRWNITKALLTAQEKFSHHHQNPYSFKMFGVNSVFDPLTTKLHAINPVNQTYQTWMGPMFLRSMEALVKPSSFDWWKEQNHTCYGETYTNIISQRDYTCNAIVKDVTCVGTPQNKLVSLGRMGEKQKKMVKMCSRPTRFERKTAEFSCDNGDSYLKLVTMPTACECVPCEEITVSATWNKDYFWTTDEHKFVPATGTTEEPHPWGNERFWADNTLNRNFNLKLELEQNGVISPTSNLNTIPRTTATCESSFKGDTWQREFFPEDMNRRVCRLPGLSKEELLKKMIERWN